MRKVWVYILLALFIAVNVILVLTAKKYEPSFVIKNLVITNNRIVPTNLLLEFINVKDKEELALLSAEIIIDRITKHPYVKNADGVFVDTITYAVRIEEVDPFLLVVTKKKNFILTKEKELIPEDVRLNILDLPIVTFTDDNLSAQKLKSEYVEVLFNSFNNIYKTDIALFEAISELNIDNTNQLTFYLTKPRGKIIAGKDIDPVKAVYLSEFYRKVILENPNISYDYIDLRFNEQIVVKVSNTKIS